MEMVDCVGTQWSQIVKYLPGARRAARALLARSHASSHTAIQPYTLPFFPSLFSLLRAQFDAHGCARLAASLTRQPSPHAPADVRPSAVRRSH
jgi:hypothetical protein